MATVRLCNGASLLVAIGVDTTLVPDPLCQNNCNLQYDFIDGHQDSSPNNWCQSYYLHELLLWRAFVFHAINFAFIDWDLVVILFQNLRNMSLWVVGYIIHIGALQPANCSLECTHWCCKCWGLGVTNCRPCHVLHHPSRCDDVTWIFGVEQDTSAHETQFPEHKVRVRPIWTQSPEVDIKLWSRAGYL